jgi:hypothetical protein
MQDPKTELTEPQIFNSGIVKKNGKKKGKSSERLRHFFFVCPYRSAHFAQQKMYSLPLITVR